MGARGCERSYNHSLTPIHKPLMSTQQGLRIEQEIFHVTIELEKNEDWYM